MTTVPLTPPGPRRILFLRHQPDVFLRMARKYGDVMTFTTRRRPVFLVSRPDLVAQVLRDHDTKFVKEWGPRRGHPVLADGLLTSEGSDHRAQRQYFTRSFSRTAMLQQRSTLQEVIDDWSARRRSGETIDLLREMSLLASDLVARVLFGSRVDPTALQDFGEVVNRGFRRVVGPFAFRRRPDDPRPLGATTVASIRRNRFRDGLLSAVFDLPEREGDAHIRTFVIAGQETIRLAMVWSWFLLSMHPESEHRWHGEIDRGDETRFTEAVMREAMRLYPPQWMLGKRALEDYPLGEYVAPRGSVVLTSPYVVHRDERWFPRAEQFMPERWLRGETSAAYFPFGGGARRCIGEAFAMIEGTMMLSTIGRHWRFACSPRSGAIDARLGLTPRRMFAKVMRR
jgi:cytochrome P450